MNIQSVVSLIKLVILLYRKYYAYGAIFVSWEESKYYLDDHSDLHSESINISINAIDITPDVISTLVPTDIYISTNDDSVDYADSINSSESFVTENLDPSFDRDNLLDKEFKIHRITSKSPDNTTASTTGEHHNADTIRAKMDTGAKISCSNPTYIIHNYKPYTYNF